MKKILLIVLIFLHITPLMAQKHTEGLEKYSLQVIAVKGKVVWNSKELKKNDIIEIYSLKSLPTSLKYASSSDWVNFVNKKDKKVLNFYAQQKKAADGKYLFARGTENPVDYSTFFAKGIKQINSDIALLSYFDRPIIFLFDNDTIVCPDLKIYELDAENKFYLNYIIDGNTVSTLIGSNDTVIISKKTFSANTENTNSFVADSLSLIYYNGLSKEKTAFALQNFNIYFFEDVVRGLRTIGMNNKNIQLELTTYFVGYDQLAIQSGLKEEGEIDKWLYGKIKEIK